MSKSHMEPTTRCWAIRNERGLPWAVCLAKHVSKIMLDDTELAAIDDYRFANRMPSRAAAVRQLLRLGMKAVSGKRRDGMKSTDYGLVRDKDGSGD